MSMKKQTASTYEKAAHETLRSAYEIGERRIAEAVDAERERCAEKAEDRVERWLRIRDKIPAHMAVPRAIIQGRMTEAQAIAAAIRAGPEEQ